MPTTDTMTSEATRQHERWAAARERLWVSGVRQTPTMIGWAAPVSLIGTPSYRTILRLVSLRRQMPVRDILGPGRSQPAAGVRHEAAALIYTHTEMTLGGVAAIFGRDHSMVACAVRKFERKRRAQ